MDLYEVIIPPGVWRRIDEIVDYIEENFSYEETAESVLERIEQEIYSLDKDPNRGAPRKTGKYAYKGYRQVFAGNYIIVYRVDEMHRRVDIETVRHMLEDF